MAEKKVVGIKVGAEDYRRLEIIADRENMSISAILKLCVNAIINNEIELEKGELKLGVNYVCKDLDTPFGEKVEQKLNKLREREYPERFIESLKEQMLTSLDAQIEMLPKKFNSKRMKSDDWGC